MFIKSISISLSTVEYILHHHQQHQHLQWTTTRYLCSDVFSHLRSIVESDTSLRNKVRTLEKTGTNLLNKVRTLETSQNLATNANKVLHDELRALDTRVTAINLYNHTDYTPLITISQIHTATTSPTTNTITFGNGV